jgi:opacity protein-like surface antigen
MRSLTTPAFLITATAMIAGINITTTAQAADMAAPFGAMPQAVNEPQVEFGTGWYLRGDVAAALDTMPKLNTDGTFGLNSKKQNGYSATAGIGYKFNNWLRADVTYDLHKRMDTQTREQAKCVLTWNGLNPPTVGTYTTCNADSTSEFTRNTVLLNGYVDLGTYSGFTPYVGAGIGVARVTSKYKQIYSFTNGLLYNTYCPPDVSTGTPVAQTSVCKFYDSKGSGVRYNTAFALMAGLSYDLNQNAKVDIGYRYMDMGTVGAVSPTGTASKVKLSSQEVRVGVRYMID